MMALAVAFFSNISFLRDQQCRIKLCPARMARIVSIATVAAVWLLLGALKPSLGTNDDQQAVKLLDQARK
jgi:hypothetical protein